MNATWVEHLIDEYSSGLLRWLVQHCHNREDAEDIMQDVFISVYEHCEEFDPARCNEQAWLYIIARRKVVSYYRSHKNEDSIDEMEDWQIPGETPLAQADSVIAARQAVAKALSALDERSKQIIVLRFFEGLSAEETGDRLGLSAGNVRVIQSRAMKAMQDCIGDFDFSDF